MLPTLRRRRHLALAALHASLLAAGIGACGDSPRSDNEGDDADALAVDAGPDADPADVPPADTVDDATDTADAGDAPDAPDATDSPDAFRWRDPTVFEPSRLIGAALADELGEISGWATHVLNASRPAVGALGGFGTGNGRAFALFGYGDPLNSMHSLAAPTYEKNDGFFGDYALELRVAGAPLPFDEEWAARSLEGPGVLTRGRAGAITLDTLDFAPVPDGAAGACMVRLVEVSNSGDGSTSDVVVRVHAYGRTLAVGATLVEQRETRALTTAASIAATASDGALDIALPSLAPGESALFDVRHCAAVGADGPPVPEGDALEWYRAATAEYRAWEANLTDYELPDPMLDDFVEGMKLTLHTQTAASGATCPMSQYTRTWARDNIGPVLAWHAYGAFEEARATMDYVYGAVLLGGDFSNSYAADLDLSSLPDPPDWDAMPPLSGRVGAETPSYMVWIYGEQQRAAGGTDFVARRWGFLKRALRAQAFDDELRLPFTDDETYRAAMNAAFGLSLEYPHAELNGSANSSLLWLGAERQYARLARLIGEDAEADDADAFAARVEQAALTSYLLEDGCVAAFVERESGDVSPPFEDVALKATWGGWLDGDDPRAAANVACLIDRIGIEPGIIRSPLDPSYQGLALLGGGDGVLTGMLPGYTLAALTSVGHPDALAALAAMDRFTSTSGNFQEYLDASTESGLQPIYERSGVQGDYTSKYRPWEGGINVRAVLDYLFGVTRDADAGLVTLRPHLPPGWPEMRANALRVGDERFDVVVERRADAVAVVVSVDADATRPLTFELRWDDVGEVAVSVDGATVDAATSRDTAFGLHSVETPAVEIAPGGAQTWTFAPATGSR
ncbi:MAG: hypothetical protein H6699_10810 [Myxococcales bacterium]|nr:hypothetical protein [Myxococcales bacterium]